MSKNPWRTTPRSTDDTALPSSTTAASVEDGGPARRRPGAGSVLAACGALVVGLLGGLGIGTAVASPGQATEAPTSGTASPGTGATGGQDGTSAPDGTDGWIPGGGTGQVPGGPPPGGAAGGGTAPDETTGTVPDGTTGTLPDSSTLDGGTGAVSDPVTYVVQTTSSAGGPGDVPPPHASATGTAVAVLERRYDV